MSGVSLGVASVDDISLGLAQQVPERIVVVRPACPSVLPSCTEPDVKGIRQLLRFVC